MTIHRDSCSYGLHSRFIDTLNKELQRLHPEAGRSVVLHFKDPEYSADQGGFHPVEIMIQPTGKLNYITDFSYVGIGPYAELEKELDFDFSLNLFGHRGHDYPLDAGREIFQIWQENFVFYYGMGVYVVRLG